MRVAQSSRELALQGLTIVAALLAGCSSEAPRSAGKQSIAGGTQAGTVRHGPWKFLEADGVDAPKSSIPKLAFAGELPLPAGWLSVSPHSGWLAIGVANEEGRREIAVLDASLRERSRVSLQANTDTYLDEFVFGGSGRHLFARRSTTNSGEIVEVDLETAAISRTVSSCFIDVQSAHPTEPIIAALSFPERQLTVISTETGQSRRLTGPDPFTVLVGFAPGGLVLLRYFEPSVELRDLTTGKLLRKVILPEGRSRVIPVGKKATVNGKIAYVPGSLHAPCVYVVSLLDDRVTELTAPGMRRPDVCGVSTFSERLYVADVMASRMYAFDLKTNKLLGWMDVKDPVQQIVSDPANGRLYVGFRCGEVMWFSER
jgi:hypothetical protein